MDQPTLDDLQIQLRSYTPSPDVEDLVKKTRILFLVGPTGAGKDSLKDKLMKTGQFHHIVSYTTRQPRINKGIPEKDGVEYHFIDIPTAGQMLRERKFIEAKIYSGNLYGTSVSEIEEAQKQDKIAMTDLEIQGVREYKKISPNIMAMFLLPPGFKVWQERLQKRYGDVVDVIDYQRRLKTALVELNEFLATDYYIPVINKDLQHLFNEVEAILAGHDRTPEQKEAREIARQLADDIRSSLKTS